MTDNRTTVIRISRELKAILDKARGGESYNSYISRLVLPIGETLQKHRFGDWKLHALQRGESEEFLLPDHEELAKLNEHLKYIHKTYDMRLKLEVRMHSGQFLTTVHRVS